MSFNESLKVLMDTSIDDLGAIEEDLSTMYVIFGSTSQTTRTDMPPTLQLYDDCERFRSLQAVVS